MSIEGSPKAPTLPAEEKGPQTPEDRILHAYAKQAEKVGLDTSEKAEALLGESLRVDGAEVAYKKVRNTGNPDPQERTYTIGNNTDKDVAAGRLQLVGQYAYVGTFDHGKLAFVNHRGEMRLMNAADERQVMRYQSRLKESGYTKALGGVKAYDEDWGPNDKRFPFPFYEKDTQYVEFVDAALQEAWKRMETTSREGRSSKAAPK